MSESTDPSGRMTLHFLRRFEPMHDGKILRFYGECKELNSQTDGYYHYDPDKKEIAFLWLTSNGNIIVGNVNKSSIVFSIGNASGEDEILQTREVFNLKLNADLITLSACQTGLGQFIKGEGIEGLSRAFFYARASSALISLWAVHDQATSQFMEIYYSYLRSSNSIMSALQKTKLEMIGSAAVLHPYYWAGFIVKGNADKVIYPSTAKRLWLILFFLCLAGTIIYLVIFKKFFRVNLMDSSYVL